MYPKSDQGIFPVIVLIVALQSSRSTVVNDIGNHLIQLLEPMNVTNPILVCDREQFLIAASFIRSLAFKNQAGQALILSRTTETHLRLRLLNQPSVWISSDIQTLIAILQYAPIDTHDYRIAFKHPMLVVSKAASQLSKSINLTLDQQVYFLDQDSRNVYENYIVNSVRIHKVLGRFDENLEGWIQAEKIAGNAFDIIEQRSNFYGKRMVAMTDVEEPYLVLDHDYKTRAKTSNEIPDTFEVLKLQ